MIRNRYDELYELVNVFKPRFIVEVGTWTGNNAKNMINIASQFHTDVIYQGFDLFEEATEETDKQEFNVKPHTSRSAVMQDIVANCPQAAVKLVQGNTRETLNTSIAADFAFIDGGHSIETIAHDYEMLKHSKVIVLDDYYTPEREGMGCNQLVKDKPHFVMQCKDWVKGGGEVSLVVMFGG